MYQQPHRQALYQCWRSARRDGRLGPEWHNDFDAYYEWAMANGYEAGKQILRNDRTKLRGPDNCYVCTIGVDSKTLASYAELATAFNQAVAKFKESLSRSTPETRAKTIRLIESGRLWYGYSNNYSSAKNRG